MAAGSQMQFITVWQSGQGARPGERLGAILGIAALALVGVAHIIPTYVISQDNNTPSKATLRQATSNATTTPAAGNEWAFGGYGGIAYTYPSEVHFKNPSRTDMTVRDFGWIGRPFKSPIYYGLRIQRWGGAGYAGAMLDFTHAKAIARRNDIATFSGTLNGKPVPEKQRMGDVFRHLEFSHGHNMLTLNGLVRLAPAWNRFRPYFGVGVGISVPHTEIGIRSEGERTYEYQFAGFVGQALTGLEIQLGRTSFFLEYKFTYAPYDVPLSHEPYGWLVVTDLWRQFTAWWAGEVPPGGHATTTLASHHGIAGVLIRSRASAYAAAGN